MAERLPIAKEHDRNDSVNNVVDPISDVYKCSQVVGFEEEANIVNGGRSRAWLGDSTSHRNETVDRVVKMNQVDISCSTKAASNSRDNSNKTPRKSKRSIKNPTRFGVESRLEQQFPLELIDKCKSIVQFLMKKDKYGYFWFPVDPVALGFPTYNQIITEPMDLGTIQKKLRSSEIESPHEFARLTRLVFENAMTFNVDPLDPVHQVAKDLLTIFNDKFEAVEQRIKKSSSTKKKTTRNNSNKSKSLPAVARKRNEPSSGHDIQNINVHSNKKRKTTMIMVPSPSNSSISTTTTSTTQSNRLRIRIPLKSKTPQPLTEVEQELFIGAINSLPVNETPESVVAIFQQIPHASGHGNDDGEDDGDEIQLDICQLEPSTQRKLFHHPVVAKHVTKLKREKAREKVGLFHSSNKTSNDKKGKVGELCASESGSSAKTSYVDNCDIESDDDFIMAKAESAVFSTAEGLNSNDELGILQPPLLVSSNSNFGLEYDSLNEEESESWIDKALASLAKTALEGPPPALTSSSSNVAVGNTGRLVKAGTMFVNMMGGNVLKQDPQQLNSSPTDEDDTLEKLKRKKEQEANSAAAKAQYESILQQPFVGNLDYQRQLMKQNQRNLKRATQAETHRKAVQHQHLHQNEQPQSMSHNPTTSKDLAPLPPFDLDRDLTKDYERVYLDMALGRLDWNLNDSV